MTALTDEVRDICAANGVQTILARPHMDAHAQLRTQLNVIHGELAARGIHSAKIDNATYSIETLCRGYMEPDRSFDWIPYKLTPTEERIASLLHKRFGKNTNRESILDAMYFEGSDHLESPRKMVDIFIFHLRRKLINSPFAIELDRGIGYRMVLKPTALALTALQELQAH